MSRPPIIGIAGPARTGKDTVANFIVAAVGGYRYSFAEPMKAMLAVGLGVDMHDPYWQKRKEDNIPALGCSPRQLMQTLGTEWGRVCVREDLWILLAQNKLLAMGPGMVINDVRLETEAAWVRKLGGSVVHVIREGAPKVREHSTEAGIKLHDSDAVIKNNGSIEELQNEVKAVIGEF